MPGNFARPAPIPVRPAPGASVLQPPAVSADRLAKMVEMLGLAWDGAALADLCTKIKGVGGAPLPAPFAAAAIAAHVVAMRPDSELLAW